MKIELITRKIKYSLFTFLLMAAFFNEKATAQIIKPKQRTTSEQSATTNSPTRTRSASADSPSQWNNDWRITFGGGTALFFGDVKQYTFYPVFNYKSEWRFNTNLLIERQISPVFSLRGQGVYAHYTGTRREWNRNLIAKNIEFNLNTAIDLNNLFGRDRKDRFFTTSVILGVGLANFNSTLYELNSGNVVATGGFGSGSGINGQTLEGIVVGGLSFDFRLNENWSLRLETANRIMNSDYFDLTPSGTFKYDVYNNTSIGISYTFNSAKKRVSMVPESEPELIVVPKEPVTPDKSLNQVVEVLAVEKEPVVETAVVETLPTIEKNAVITDVEYRVQIRARYDGKVPIADLSRKYNIPENEISESTHNQYYIYTVGSFATYEQAAEKRNEIKSVNKVYDAFIVAFKNGNRLDKLPK
jgi:hypothetical protein